MSRVAHGEPPPIERLFDAATGHAGIVQAAQCRPEIILLDLGLPDLEGVEVLKRIRECRLSRGRYRRMTENIGRF